MFTKKLYMINYRNILRNNNISIFSFFWLISTLVSVAQVSRKTTEETKNLYKNLFKLREKGTMFGQQDALAYGLTENHTRWIGLEDQSDIKTVCGQHPSVFGWDLGHIELDKNENLDQVSFEFMRNNILKIYENGGISTLSWHPNNPLDLQKSSWDKMEQTIPKILKDKAKLKEYKLILDKLAIFFQSLESKNKIKVPVIFRPFHEHTGSWFWWGADHCSPEEYKAFWILTFNYLTKTKKVKNLIWAYSTDNFNNEQHYLERYPGDKYVDLLGFDTYHRNAPASNASFINNTQRMVATIAKLANEKKKLTAITETGLEKVTEPTWWTSILSPIINNASLSYVLVWRNGRPDHYYSPYKGQISEPDFLAFIKSDNIILENKLKSSNIYKKH